MKRVLWLAAAVLLLAPGVSHAVQLHWSSGADTLTFTEATRAILVLRADSAEVTLPPEWRLLWVGDSTEVQVAALDSLEVCEADTAQVYDVDGPSTLEDSTAHRVTAHFCSGGSGAAEQATFVLDLPAWGRGKCRVVALDPTDSTSVLESNEVTFNGGVEDDYPACIVRATSTHHLGQLGITVEGSGLATIQRLSIVAPDTSWRFPLDIVSRSDSLIRAEGTLAAPLPPCTVEAMVGGTTVATASLPADSFPAPDSPENYCFFFYPGALDSIHLQPKDFTFVFTGDAWHVFYIRHHQNPGYTDDVNERNLGHAISTDLQNWTVVSRNVLQVPGTWDTKHVWAPHVVRKPNDITYHMFYTGVDGSDNQKIGVATSTDLSTWTRTSTAILSANDILWADPNPPAPYDGHQQFRDPFVMPDLNTPGQWLMYYVTVARDRTPDMVVGVAKSPAGNFQGWQDLTPLWKTSSRLVGSSRTESPHSFEHHGKWWVMYTPTYGAADTVRFEVNDTNPANTDTLSWGPHIGSVSPSERLYSVTQGYETPWTFLNAWHATEYMQFRGGEYLAAWDDYNQSIDFVQLVQSTPPDSFNIICPTNVGVPPTAAGTPREVALSVSGVVPVRQSAALRLALPIATHVDLAIYDVQGRRVRGLLNGWLPAGVTTASWDGRDRDGRAVGSGVYFARLLCPHAQRVARVPLIR